MYIIRLDDASEHWNKPNWERMHSLLQKYNIQPIIAIIPHNEDEKLLKYPEDSGFWELMHFWISEGWTPALHGYNHVYSSMSGGINPVNRRSEFAGVDYEIQRGKIREGYKLLCAQGIVPEVFVAPAHTFDENTLLALKEETRIRIISDTVATDLYFEDGFTYIPQQSGNVRSIRLKLVTFCYHPNTMHDSDFETLEKFILAHKNEFISFEKLNSTKRKRSLFDKVLSSLYFAIRRFR